MKYALPLTLLATPALAHPGALHSHASVPVWLALAAIAAAAVVPPVYEAVVAWLRK